MILYKFKVSNIKNDKEYCYIYAEDTIESIRKTYKILNTHNLISKTIGVV